MNFLKLCIAFFSAFCFTNANFNTTISNRQSKAPLLGLGIGVVQFANSVCTASGGLLGGCYRKRQCSEITGGFASGTCASKLGVCCVVQLGCGTSSSLNNTYFINRGFPAPYYSSNSCMHTIKRCNSNICQVRIDFLTLVLAQPNGDGICTLDSINIIGGAWTVPPICGENSGQHIYLNFNADNDINIIISTSSGDGIPRSWNIKIAQIACDCPTLAPTGCLMYYTAASGTVKSFNYGTTVNNNLNANRLPGTREIANLRYGVCVAVQPGYCSIRWSQSSGDPYSFTLTGNTIGLAVNPGLPFDPMLGASCTTDFIVIPNPIGVVADRFCGNALPALTSASKPFVLSVITDGNEGNDIGNRGFSLSYSQIRCTGL